AVLSCIGAVDGPMAVINADDYYGSHAFALAWDFLTQDPAARKETGDEAGAVSMSGEGRYMMVGYRLENTLTENGSVARGVCETDDQGYLKKITERTCIERHGDEIAYTEDGGKTWTPLPADGTVSLNMWGFSADILDRLREKFCAFLEENLQDNPLKCEYFLPFVVDELLSEKRAAVKVTKSPDKWYGVTYREDKPVLMAAIQKMKEEGLYPQRLWEDDK
ncbi:MAG: nucleotidyltransferase, partial [Lachnospiraceae bacterium]|nr:nucleotidyltransferase [Lachnospiraceae bacterium]